MVVEVFARSPPFSHSKSAFAKSALRFSGANRRKTEKPDRLDPTAIRQTWSGVAIEEFAPFCGGLGANASIVCDTRKTLILAWLMDRMFAPALAALVERPSNPPPERSGRRHVAAPPCARATGFAAFPLPEAPDGAPAARPGLAVMRRPRAIGPGNLPHPSFSWLTAPRKTGPAKIFSE
jgi:hypothetical protein